MNQEVAQATKRALEILGEEAEGFEGFTEHAADTAALLSTMEATIERVWEENPRVDVTIGHLADLYGLTLGVVTCGYAALATKDGERDSRRWLSMMKHLLTEAEKAAAVRKKEAN